jgi:ribonuclease HI
VLLEGVPQLVSYQLKTRTGQQVIERLKFSAGTTKNQAEYHALIGGLVDLLERIQARGRSASDLTLQVIGDSQLVLNQVQGAWGCKKEHLRPLRDYAQQLAGCFKEVKFTWVNR